MGKCYIIGIINILKSLPIFDTLKSLVQELYPKMLATNIQTFLGLTANESVYLLLPLFKYKGFYQFISEGWVSQIKSQRILKT